MLRIAGSRGMISADCSLVKDLLAGSLDRLPANALSSVASLSTSVYQVTLPNISERLAGSQLDDQIPFQTALDDGAPTSWSFGLGQTAGRRKRIRPTRVVSAYGKY